MNSWQFNYFCGVLTYCRQVMEAGRFDAGRTQAPKSGIYERIGPRGGRTGEEADSTRGKPLRRRIRLGAPGFLGEQRIIGIGPDPAYLVRLGFCTPDPAT